ncbi:MAG: pantoate--beta-alanine ligase [Gammaproteobacteria bacterium]
METLHTVADLRAAVARWRSAGERVALVPTMGNLHEGHLRLVDRARELAGRVVVSIFVNPTQFGPGEDFERYPRTLEADSEKLARRNVDLVFAPGVEEVYPEGSESRTRVEVTGISDQLCGEFRPGHFVGVATVVAKLLNMAQPDVAVFGTKDYQQLKVIRWLVEDLCLPVVIEGVETVREANGLAMSSRNAYLSAGERETAAELYRTLRHTAERLRAGEHDFSVLEQEALAHLRSRGFRPDYYAIRRAADLQSPGPEDKALVVLVAAHLGDARLIDNLEVRLP